MREIDADYYGYRDEDDGVIVPLEIEAQREAIGKLLEKAGKPKDAVVPILPSNGKDDENEGVDFVGPRRFVSHVPSIPTQLDVREELLRRKKEEMLSKYTEST